MGFTIDFWIGMFVSWSLRHFWFKYFDFIAMPIMDGIEKPYLRKISYYISLILVIYLYFK